jgi:hypothetical protein
MPKINIQDVQSLTNEQSALDKINTNFDTIVDESDNFLSRTGASPNAMEADLDMDGNRILNLPAPVQDHEPIRLADVDLLTSTGIVGPQGPEGEQGDQGIQGPQVDPGDTGPAGTPGADGESAYVYIAYASDGSGTGFTTTFNSSLDYIAIKNSAVEIPSPVVGDFTGLWKNYKGATGSTGSAGADGADGITPATTSAFSTTTTDADPGAGTVRFNNATPASVTNIYFDNTDSGSIDVTAWLDSFDNSTHPTSKGTLTIVPVASPSDKLIYTVSGTVVDGTGYRKVPAVHVAGTTLPSDAAVLAFVFSRTGDTGASGAGTGDVNGPASSVNGEIALFDGTTGDLLKSATGSGMVKVTSGVFAIATPGVDYDTVAGGLGDPVDVDHGGTGADLSATGGTGRVLKQLTTGADITVATLAASELSNGTTGSGSVALATSPTLVTPVLGAATATSINNVAITNPGSSATFTLSPNKTLTVNNTITLAGTDGTAQTLPSTTQTIVGRSSVDTLTNKTISGATNTLTVRDQDLSLTDVTTNNASTTKHGFLPKLTSFTTDFLRGDGSWGPAGGVQNLGGIKGQDVMWYDNVSQIFTSFGPVNVIAYGADPNGVTDSTSAIQSAWNAWPIIYIPAGKYKISAPLVAPNIAGNYGIIGDGPTMETTASGGGYVWPQGTMISATHTTGNIITCRAGTGGAIFHGFTALRTSQATSGYGLDATPSSTVDKFHLSNLRFANSNIGLHLGSVGYGIAQDIICENNRLHGFDMQGQWQLQNCFAANNGGSGFNVQAAAPASSGQWRGLSTFNNGAYGIIITATSSANRIEGVRLSDSFFGSDGIAEIYMDTFSTTPHVLTNVYTEDSGSSHCMSFTINNHHISLVNCVALTAAGAGVVFACPGSVVGGEYSNNAALGITATGAATKVSVLGARATGNASTNISLTNINAATIHGCYATSIATAGTVTVSNVGNYT